MSFTEFERSLSLTTPPAEISSALLGLWHDARGDWTRAHQCVQDDATPEGAWVHAYLHRKEEDEGNAAYWYGRAGRPVATGPLEDEWRSVAQALVA